jgi:hypothetical protein
MSTLAQEIISLHEQSPQVKIMTGKGEIIIRPDDSETVIPPTKRNLSKVLKKKGYADGKVKELLQNYDDTPLDESPKESGVKEIRTGFIIPSACYSVGRKLIGFRKSDKKKPEIGDLVYGSILSVGEHYQLENREGRLHNISIGTKSIFVYGCRYAPDAYEAILPSKLDREVDLVARSGIVGTMRFKNTVAADCTKVKLYGYICDKDGNVINTKNYKAAQLSEKTKGDPKKKNMILCIGSSMNSGKSTAAAHCCWALSTLGFKVNACKITGTASLKDILLAEDSGASEIGDFSYLGFPSTYMLEESDVVGIYTQLRERYGTDDYWVVEIADGMVQRETSMLLKSKEVRDKIYKLIYCAQDVTGVVGGLKILKEQFDLVPDAISGRCASSPLSINEYQEFTDIPSFNSLKRDLTEVVGILL